MRLKQGVRGRFRENHVGSGIARRLLVVSCILLVTSSLLVLTLGVFAEAKSEHSLFEAVEGLDKPVGTYEPKTSSSLTLVGARGEVLSFLIKVKQQGCRSLKLSTFESAAKRKALFEFKFFRVEKITTTEPSFTGAYVGEHLDPLVPLVSKEYCDKTGTVNWLLAEFKIPFDQDSGIYDSKIELGSGVLKLRVTVWPMTMPSRVRLPMYAEMSPYSNLKGHFGKWAPGEDRLAEKYNEILDEHNVYSLKSSIVHPKVVVIDEVPTIDIYNQPDSQQSFYSVVVKNRNRDAYYDFPTTAYSNMLKDEENNYYKAVEEAAVEINRPGKALLYLWDEPHEPDFPRLLDLLQRVKKLAPSVKTLVTMPAYEKFRSYVDIFCPVMNHFDEAGYPEPAVYAALQKKGKEVWWYVSCMSHGCDALQNNPEPDFVIERPSAWIRSVGWLSMKYSINAFLYYMVNVGYNKHPGRDPWQSVWEFSGNGDGTLVYPGRAGERGFEEHQPVASLRLKLWRESSQDAQYVQWMETLKSKPNWWQQEFNTLVKNPRQWNQDYSAYARFRKKIGDYLAVSMSKEQR
jgi:Domain of unknown function (DUF4091)